jgi:citrate lyase subunit beta/citryl-CoA lyase
LSWKARRSCLAVPATQPRFLEKADQSAADEIFLDLEDSVAAGAKEKARAMVVDALRRYRFEGKLRVVRVNAADTPWCFGDVVEVIEGAGARVDCLMLPKVEGPGDVHFIDRLLNQLERKLGLPRRVGLELQIESPAGLTAIDAIATASARTETLIFGPADFAAAMRFPTLGVGALNSEYPGDFWHHFMATITVAARARGLQAVDGPYGQVRDLEGLRTAARRSAMLGFDGKWALTPAQVDILNEEFSPSQEEFDHASAILDAYRHASEEEGRGAVMLGDEMIDEASRKMAAVMVDRGLALDMQPRPWQPSS